jgi:metallo-beta-lactamase family protein
LRILVSGDLGPDAKLLQQDPEGPTGLDYIVCESTYGDTDRPQVTIESRRTHLADEMKAAYAVGGPLLVPAFAVERTQELIVDMITLMQRGAVPESPIFLDSPMAIRATEVFCRYGSTFDEAIAPLLSSPLLHGTETVEESKALAKLSGFHIVLAGSGMCEAGRIRHHLKRWLWDPSATVLLTGFQAQGTLGRFLHDGAPAVRIQGEEFKVKARVRTTNDYSGHADGPELARWLASRRPIRRGVFLVHGEEAALRGLNERLAERIIPSAQIHIPLLDDCYELTTTAPTPLDVVKRRRLAPEAVINLDWHNDMSKLILDINDVMEAAADDRRRGVMLRRLRRALEAEPEADSE